MASPTQGNTPRAPSAFGQRTGEEHLRRLGAFESNPEVEAVLRKLVRDVDGRLTDGQTVTHGDISVPDPAYMRQIAGTIGQDTTDATSLMQLLPDLELIQNFTISSILAPKDLNSTEVTFSVDRRGFSLPIAGQMLEHITDHFTNVYNIKALLPLVLKDALFLTGSYPILVIPENAVDELINGTTQYSAESFTNRTTQLFDAEGSYRSMRLLGPGPIQAATAASKPRDGAVVSALESFRGGGMSEVPDGYARALGEEFSRTVVITDNYNVAKLGPVMEARRQTAVHQSLGVPAFALEGAANYALGGAQRVRRTFGIASLVQAVKTDDMLATPMVGHPLVMKIPSEAVIPVFITPEKHLGYFLLLDTEGNFIRLANRRDIYNDLSTQNNGVGSSTQGASQMIQMAQNLSIGVNPQEAKDPAQMVKIYGQLLEHELKTRLANGVAGRGGKIAPPQEIYQIMMARSMKRQQTQILYVPAELLTYFAFEYATNGTGRSMTERSKIIGSMRAMLTFSNVMAGIKNSVSRQKVTLTLSDNDIDPAKTIARTMDEFTRRRNVTMPFVASEPADMISYVNMAGVEWNIEGKGAPAHKVDIEDKVSNRAKVDTELDNSLRDRHYQSFGTPPELVLGSASPEFATTIVTNNQMYAKHVISKQDELTPQAEKLVRMIARNSAVVMNQLRQTVIQSLVNIDKAGEADDQSDLVDQKAGALKPQTEALPVTGSQPTPTPGKPPVPMTPERAAKIDRIVYDFIASIKLALPRPDTATLESQNKAFDAQSEAYDKGLSMMIDSTFANDETLGEFAPHIDELKAAYKALFMRQWMRSNGFLPELEQILAVDENGKPELDLLKAVTDHNGQLGQSVHSFLQALGKTKEAIHKQSDELSTLFPEANLNSAGAASPAGDAGGYGADEGGMGGSGGGDLGGDMGGGDNDGLDLDPDGVEAGAGGEPGDGSGEGSQAPQKGANEATPTADTDTVGDALSTGETASGKPEEAEREEREEDEIEDEELDEQGRPIKKPKP